MVYGVRGFLDQRGGDAVGVVECGKEAFGVQGRGAAGAGGGDGLAVAVVDEVAAGEDTRRRW